MTQSQSSPNTKRAKILNPGPSQVLKPILKRGPKRAGTTQAGQAPTHDGPTATFGQILKITWVLSYTGCWGSFK